MRSKATSTSLSRLMKVWLPCLLVCFLLANLPLLGQERFSNMSGVATDASGAVLPNATVTITNKATTRSMVVKTGGDGSYLARDLEPGRYSVKFEMTGFSTFEVPDVILMLGKTMRVNAQMQVGSSQQTVQVTEESPLLDITSTAIAHNVTSEEFDRLPKTRTFQSMAISSPSVNQGDIEGGIQINGASAAENQFVIDGVSTNSLMHGVSHENATYEFLQEVQVKTGGIDAEYGGAMGGVISAITKSGGNAFHGDAHFYYFGNAISAGPVKRLLLDPSNEMTVSYVQDHKDPRSTYEPGYSLGGYFIKDKLWFFSSASPQWLRQEQTYLFSSGKEAATTFHRQQLAMQAFNKLSFDPTSHIRATLSWLYSPTAMTGGLPGYNVYGNQVSSTAASFASYQVPGYGYFAPQSNYSGQVDFTVSSTTMLSVKAGRFWDNYKTTGVPGISSVSYQTPTSSLSPELLATVPASLQGPVAFTNTPRVKNTFHDLATRTYGQVDVSRYQRFLGSHDLKAGFGITKMVNNVNTAYPGNGYVYVYWGSEFKSLVPGVGTGSGKYGYYEVDHLGTIGSTGASMYNMYIQDHWRILPRLTLSLGLRTENETVPSFRRSYMDYAFRFGFMDKMAPRLGASLDVFGDGKLKVYGSYGRFYDWVKYELSRGTFGGDVWTIDYRSLDTPDVFSLSGTNMPGRNLWSSDPTNLVRDRRIPSFKGMVAPGIKPMSTDVINAGVEYQLNPHTVVSARYVHNGLRRTIEDLGAVINGNEVYLYSNPGEGAGKYMSVSTATPGPIPTPKPVRNYDAMELTVTRRFASGWFGSASYVYSRLFGNYPGLMSSDEIITPTSGSSGSTTAQSWTGSIARAGTSGSRAWDADEYLFDSHGNINQLGRLATDRPNVFKFYGSKTFNFKKAHSTEIGGFFYAGSGTPLSTFVNTQNQIEVFVNGRGDLGRTPMLNQTDLVIAHEIKLGEVKKLRFEFNAINVFNQKTATYRFTDLNRGYVYPRSSSAIDLSGVDLYKGYDYMALINQTSDAKKPVGALDPRFGKDDLFNPGFQGRIGIKFMF